MESLKQLAGKLMNGYLPHAVKHNNFFINEIPADLEIEHNQSWVSSVICGVLDTIVQHSRETCIRISARKYGYVIVLEVKEAGSINGYAMACGLQEVNSLAEKIGGCLSISIQQPMTTVAFSFPNLPVAA